MRQTDGKTAETDRETELTGKQRQTERLRRKNRQAETEKQRQTDKEGNTETDGDGGRTHRQSME